MNALLETLCYFTNQQIAEYFADLGRWSRTNKSHLKNSSRILNGMVAEEILEKLPHAYRLKGSKGEANEHALAVTDAILDVLRLDQNAKILREVPLPIRRTPDAVVILEKEGLRQLCFLEIEITCSVEIINAKIKDYAEGGEKIRQWFEDSFGPVSDDFCYHLKFITDKPVPKMKGVIHESLKSPKVCKVGGPPLPFAGEETKEEAPDE